MSETILQITKPGAIIQIGAPGPQGPPGIDGAGASDWASLTGKPAEFPPEDHNHPIDQITLLSETLAEKADAVAVDADIAALQATLDSLTTDVAGKAPLAHSQAIGTITGLGSGVQAWLSVPSSANLLAALTDKTGTGLSVFNDNPTFTTGIKLPDGTASLPSIAWTSDNDGTGTGIYRSGVNRLGFVSNGNLIFQALSGGIELPSGNSINFGTSVLLNQSANVLALRNGANAQEGQIYGTYTNSGIDFVCGSLACSTTAFTIAAKSGGTGSVNLDIVLTPKGTGAVKFGANNTYDIGDSGSTARPRHGYFGGNLVAGGSLGLQLGTGTAPIYWASRSQIYSSANGNILFQNASQTDFDRLQLGGTTSSFPALKRISAGLGVKLADDSAFADLESLTVKTGAPSGGTAQKWKLGSKTAGAVTLDSANYVEAEINGVAVKLLIAT